MKLEEICVDLEWAKKLKDVGFPQDSLCWYVYSDHPSINSHGKYSLVSHTPSDEMLDISAPTAEKILKELPKFIITDNIKYRFFVEYNAGLDATYCGYRCMEKDNMFMPLYDRIVENSHLCLPFADIYCFLKEEGLLEETMNKKETLSELIGIALGEASMCWSESPKGIFDSGEAIKIQKKLINDIERLNNIETNKKD